MKRINSHFLPLVKSNRVYTLKKFTTTKTILTFLEKMGNAGIILFTTEFAWKCGEYARSESAEKAQLNLFFSNVFHIFACGAFIPNTKKVFIKEYHKYYIRE